MEKQIVITRHICKQCGHIGLPFYESKGNRVSEVLLWLFFILPGLFYTMWRSASRYPVCPKCLTPHMIPGDTAKGKRMIEERGVEPTFEYREQKKRRWSIWIFLIMLLILLTIILCYFSCGAEFKRIKDLIIPIYSALSANSSI